MSFYRRHELIIWSVIVGTMVFALLTLDLGKLWWQLSTPLMEKL